MTRPDEAERSRLARIRLLAVDIDGTLLTSDHRVLPEVRDAFAEARRAGLTVLLASARSPGALTPIMAELGHAGPCICFSGAWTGTIEPLVPRVSVDAQVCLPRAAALAIAQAGLAAGLAPSWHEARHWSVPKMAPSVEQEMRVTGQVPRVVEDLSGLAEPNKLLLIGDRALLIDLRDRLRESHGDHFDAMFSHPTYLEFLPKHVDKARAVAAVAARLGLAMEEVAAVGDAENDLGMVRAAGYGVAMGNATQSVKRAARWVTSTNDEAGTARLIRRLIESAAASAASRP